mgnify:CR=1 FL=1|tara:strand:+ start:124 stop:399 length:276 start_codon:yes stop_codon:yes gene_type:complete
MYGQKRISSNNKHVYYADYVKPGFGLKYNDHVYILMEEGKLRKKLEVLKNKLHSPSYQIPTPKSNGIIIFKNQLKAAPRIASLPIQYEDFV